MESTRFPWTAVVPLRPGSITKLDYVVDSSVSLCARNGREARLKNARLGYEALHQDSPLLAHLLLWWSCPCRDSDMSATKSEGP